MNVVPFVCPPASGHYGPPPPPSSSVCRSFPRSSSSAGPVMRLQRTAVILGTGLNFESDLFPNSLRSFKLWPFLRMLKKQLGLRVVMSDAHFNWRQQWHTGTGSLSISAAGPSSNPCRKLHPIPTFLLFGLRRTLESEATTALSYGYFTQHVGGASRGPCSNHRHDAMWENNSAHVTTAAAGSSVREKNVIWGVLSTPSWHG